MLLNKFRFHIVGWTCYIIYEIALQYAYGTMNSPSYLLFFYLIEILIFYGNYTALIRVDLLPKSFWKKLLNYLIPILIFTLGLLLKYSFYQLINANQPNDAEPEQLKQYLTSAVFRTVYTIGFSIAFFRIRKGRIKERLLGKLKLQREQEKRKHAEVESALFRSENSWLQARIKPHLLHNTLSFLYSRFKQDHEAQRAIELLTELMRFSMGKPGDDGQIELGLEWQQIEHFIELQQLRYAPKIFVSIVFVNGCPGKRIIPLVLLTIVENIFKHGDLSRPDHPALIKLISRKESIVLTVYNKLVDNIPSSRPEKIGMENVYTRLKRAYGNDGFTITIDRTVTDYSLKLELNL